MRVDEASDGTFSQHVRICKQVERHPTAAALQSLMSLVSPV